MVTFTLAALAAVSMMLPLLWAVPDMVAEALPGEPAHAATPVILIGRHRRSRKRRWHSVNAELYRVAIA